MRLKTDSFVVESNVHFPTDYNLLWDSARKSIDVIEKLHKKYGHLKVWRKISNWRYELKGLMRELGKALLEEKREEIRATPSYQKAV